MGREHRTVRWKGFPGCLAIVVAAAIPLSHRPAAANPPPGPAATPTLDAATIPKYQSPLVIPPQMPRSTSDTSVDYQIAVRQFQQQILPVGFPKTTVWGYGSADHPGHVSAGGSFFYPAFTVENTVNVRTRVKWINDLKDPATGQFLPHLLPNSVDQTLHWANPGREPCEDGPPRTDCRTRNPSPYTGPVPIVTHVHGAHVGPESDGYPEAWWLPAATNIPAGYSTRGARFGDATGANPGDLGFAVFSYPNSQSASTLWYHDHSLGMTRLNVYAGPAGFWLIRNAGDGNSDVVSGTLPGPSPRVDDVQGNNPFGTYYEIPVAIQDRSFNADGSLFYPDSRAFFESALAGMTLDPEAFPFVPLSDISPIWNPEAFFNAMVVNGQTWPYLDVQPKRYRFRLLNGCNARFLNLALFVADTSIDNPLNPAQITDAEIPFYVIGSEGGFLPQVVQVSTGFSTALPGDGTIPNPSPASDADRALLMGLAERADVIVDFTGLAPGTVVRMINTGPDAPFGGFPVAPLADPNTTGQVMEFRVVASDGNADASTPPASLVLAPRTDLVQNGPTRRVSLNEEASGSICVAALGGAPADPYTVLPVRPADPGVPGDELRFTLACELAGGVSFAPKAALLGTAEQVQFTDPGTRQTVTAIEGVAMRWMDDVTEVPLVGDTETWEIYNFTEDAHPIHLHLVQFQVVDRQLLDPVTRTAAGAPQGPEPTEAGWKDTVIAYPGQVTRLRANFDMPGLYVWHCHIVEHEDNEMMRPLEVANLVGAVSDGSGAPVAGATVRASSPAHPAGFTTTTDASGSYHFGIPAGTYDVTASTAGLSAAAPARAVSSSTPVAVDLTVAAPQPAADDGGDGGGSSSWGCFIRSLESGSPTGGGAGSAGAVLALFLTCAALPWVGGRRGR